MLLLKVIDMYYDFSELVTNTNTLIRLNVALFSIIVCLYVLSLFTRCKK